MAATSGDFMKRGIGALAVCAAALGLAACQPQAPEGHHWQWVQIAPGDRIEIAEAKCQIASNGVEQGYVAYGSQAYVTGAAIGNAIGNSIRVAQFMEQCMVASGWKRVAVANPTPPAAQPKMTPPPPVSARKKAS